MENYSQKINDAAEQSLTIKLDPDLKKSIKIISKYPVLTQYIKLCNIFNDWFDDMIKKTNDIQLKMDKGNFVYDTLRNLVIYSENGNEDGFKPMVEDLKKTLEQMFGK